MQNNDGIIFQPYSADLNLSDETHNAEGALSRLDCSLFPSNLLVCEYIVLKCFRGKTVIMVHEVSPREVSEAQTMLTRGLPRPPTLIYIYIFFSFCMGISLICILDKYVTQSST